MDFIKDGGLNCVRHYLFEEAHEIEELATGALQSPGKVVGQLTCVCKAKDSWGLGVSSDQSWAMAWCGCNGSSLPLYIGAPKKGVPSRGACPSGCELPFGRIGVGIGYPKAVPPNGTVDAERATEIVVISNCKSCGKTWNAWTLKLSNPPAITGDEPWLRRIQGLR
jgi:hypothetical protein